MLISLGLFLLTAISLLLFAGRLTSRITRISEKIDRAISGEGRINKHFVASHQEDEIGDMERNFASVMQRLHAYNRYLESMASRLAHEFRTPLSMVKSSLENLAQDNSPEGRGRYLSRAEEGTNRLSSMLDRMREATRLEQTLEMTDWEEVNLSRLIDQMVDSYRGSFPTTDFACRLPEGDLFIDGAPDLIAQALDKLVTNAVDFHTPGSTVILGLEAVSANACRIAVANTGPQLPEAMQDQLFDSMVSLRSKSESEPHLGLGLYLVRLISEFHHGSVLAENTRDGVCFYLHLPLHPQK
jgi:signal transduction histidine kinase